MIRKSVTAGFIVESTSQNVAITRPHMTLLRNMMTVATVCSIGLPCEAAMSP